MSGSGVPLLVWCEHGRTAPLLFGAQPRPESQDRQPKSPAEIIDRAIAVIGTGRADDYVPAPAQHADQLKDAA